MILIEKSLLHSII